ncbi:FadR/GntR family transcriptional regulator [Pseudochrobactrum saccharolyticum]|nr:FadR/GntR family transcriptional regulator [Pseudochrobactrum saccharolyticum]KAB0537418.1 FadR family transcriptional regulator [Pseudochrobactrum saccharolyticum]MDP8252535.1 FadR family transcriptional regulator [Pseudochrobactrum saccharolyticum]
MSEQSLHAPSRTTRPRVQKSITATLAADILNGRFKPGSMLPRENDLCEEYGVSRTVIRETIKTLESKGLVRGKPRIGTVVCEQDDWNLLDQQVLDWLGPRIVDLDLLLCVLEARRAIEPVAAELATQRASAMDIAALEIAWNKMNEAGSDIEAFTQGDVDFHIALLRASHNQVFRQLCGIIEAALRYTLYTSNDAVASRDEAISEHLELIEAIRLRDKERARNSSNKMLDLAARDLGMKDK